MGGCRCTFRGCRVNSTSVPRRHFFHFPVRHPVRCQKWIALSGNPQFAELERAQLRNKVVCQDHFEDKCFMNFKHESLVKTAVPTIIKVVQPNGNVVITEIDVDNVEANEASTSLQAPESPPSINLEEPTLLNTTIVKDPSEDIQISDLKFNLTEPESIVYKLESKPVTIASKKLATSQNSKPKLLNPLIPVNSKRIELLPIKHAKTGIFSKILTKNTKKIVRAATSSTSIIEMLDESAPKRPRLSNKQNDVDHNLQNEYVTIMEAEAVPSLDEAYKKTIMEQEAQINDLKKKLADKEKLSSKPQFATNSPKMNGTNAALSKVQLFNGIKKYLNLSMVALLRMEMFGGHEREYQPDEKLFSVELFNLGSDVYDYVQDEWRFRLPPRRDVEIWKKDLEDTNEGTECTNL